MNSCVLALVAEACSTRATMRAKANRAHLDAATAKSVATTLQALSTPSRLLILATLRDGPSTVGNLSEAVGMEQSAVSHQLRLLRNLGLVDGQRRVATSSTPCMTSTSPSSST